MQEKNDYKEEVRGLKVTGRWLKWWLVISAWYELTEQEPAIPTSMYAALVVVCLPVVELVFAPVERWLERKIQSYKIRKSMQRDRDALAS